MATGLWHPWSLAWLPNGDMLVTERNGKLRTVRDGKLDPDPIAGVPAVHSVRLSGLMEVLPHPNFAQNHFVYLTYTKDVPENRNLVATTLARGRLEGTAARRRERYSGLRSLGRRRRLGLAPRLGHATACCT